MAAYREYTTKPDGSPVRNRQIQVNHGDGRGWLELNLRYHEDTGFTGGVPETARIVRDDRDAAGDGCVHYED